MDASQHARSFDREAGSRSAPESELQPTPPPEASFESRLTIAILSRGIPLTQAQEPVRRATAEEVFRALRHELDLPKDGCRAVAAALEHLTELGLLVAKRGAGGEARYSVSAHPERIEDLKLRSLLETIVSERAARAEEVRASIPVPPVTPRAAAPLSADEINADQREKALGRQRRALTRAFERETAEFIEAVQTLRHARDYSLATAFLSSGVNTRQGMLFSSESYALPHAQRQALNEFTDWLRQRATDFPGDDPVLVIHEENGGVERKAFVSAETLRAWERQCILPLREAAESNLARIRSSLNDMVPRLNSAIGCDLLSDELGTRMLEQVEALRERLQSSKTPPDRQNYVQLSTLLTPPAPEVIALLRSADDLRVLLGKEPLGSKIVRQLEDDRIEEHLRQVSIIECGEEFLAGYREHQAAERDFRELGQALLVTLEGKRQTEGTLASDLRQELKAVIEQSVQAEFGKFPLATAFARSAWALFSGADSPTLSGVTLQAHQAWIEQRFKPLLERMQRHAEGMIASLESIQTNIGIATQRSAEEADILEGLRDAALAMRRKLSEPSGELLDRAGSSRQTGASAEVAAAIERLTDFYKRRLQSPNE